MGKVFRFSDDVNTDEIIPGRYNVTTDPKALAEHCFFEVRPDFSKTVKGGDFIVAGENFGCGSSREHAPIAIKASGIKAVIAKSFARIFYRNCINIGLPIMISDELYDLVKDGEDIEVNLKEGTIKILKTGKVVKSKGFPDFILKIIDAGGIVNFLKNHDIGELEDGI
ncbi:MAG: Isopropylmalate/citramalate isomerase small subunit [Candidatus Methanofastidiosum methylothiophilum]|uniref:3-isopropylmalate dehydratase small subunit n=1 Tax=Candidatus Methanofastidiosum methylothiophilum TaxID=1705564 RepID=A0A150JII3_9EURY|nr:MAG: Isopropylmalate/citramalate isomerase small subunit [Candidatus Methanofastidiosum methylthiophilus]MBP6932295.1 3-isopropylmalate dehydratase small subunit [Methanofastidiosum sp.]OQC51557.1 MAG: Isopropylmalate/citramalate isomerase small subunit [Euryarchaeota archaeon ADurb.Bin023]KYC57015.1 MAG: Isopropylmalate/citramalate isomerase small subunit [Candidatus Methanofastidiosum methylthiophilus]KYC57961.1 MAG: Isopropylmalate/citramalate isomerase small subunit [Candidatus Methanofa